MQEKKKHSPPQFPQKLPGSFWGMTTYFNPAKYKNKLENYKKFRESSKRQGLNLLAVELAFNSDPFELTKDDAEILVQVRSNSIMWQKERLLNIGLKHLPQDCDKVAWIDCDLIFKNNNWIEEASKLLEKYIVVQLFSFFVSLPKEGEGVDIWQLPFGISNGKVSLGMAHNFAKLRESIFSTRVQGIAGRPGGAWAGRREALEECGFFDKSVLGSNDSIQNFSFYRPIILSKGIFPEKFYQEQGRWLSKINNLVKGSFFYIDNVCLHLWHGSVANRKYVVREEAAQKANFDPDKDLKINEYGCFEWSSKKPELHQAVRNYFFERCEEGEDDAEIIPQFPQKLPGSFWGMTTYFNPAKYKNKLENYKKFRESSKRQGLNLLAVELAFNSDPFELTKDDAEILVQVRSNSIMWQKERLLNIGLKHLPQDCDKVAWIDCDLIFKNNNWIEEASKLLEKYIVVQLFSFFVSLPKEGEGVDIWQLPFGIQSKTFSVGSAYVMNLIKNCLIFSKHQMWGRPGGAWAGRRETLEECGFFDKSVLGSGDDIAAYAFFGNTSPDFAQEFSEKLKADQEWWAKKIFSLVKGSCFYLDNLCLHLWHGEFSNRRYVERHELLKKYDFYPGADLKINKHGVFEWASTKKALHYRTRKYFFDREEELHLN